MSKRGKKMLMALAAGMVFGGVQAAEKLPTDYGNPANDLVSGAVEGLAWTGAARAYKLGGELVLVFTNTAAGSCAFEIAPRYAAEVRYLLVGGGGPGGGATANGLVGGGGGAGGLLASNGCYLASGHYAVTVGMGGIPVGSNESKAINNNGSDSVVALNGSDVLRALGGGGGGTADGSWDDRYVIGRDGGSGGGAALVCCYSRDGGKGMQGQGNNGGRSKDYPSNYYPNAGGGGGAGAPGQDAPGNTTSGNGGDGLPCDITGEEVWYAGGGAGGAFGQNAIVSGGRGGGAASTVTSTSAVSDSGVDGLGGGGAGAAVVQDAGISCAANRGGNGVVIVRFTQMLLDEPLPGVSFTGEANWYNLGRGKTRETVVIYTNVNEVGTLTLGRRATARVLLVGGGGAGGFNNEAGRAAAGGGAGGMVTNDLSGTMFKRGTYRIMVGRGGLGSTDKNVKSENGADSTLSLGQVDLFRAQGGGAGGCAADGDQSAGNGQDGGSGGGAACYYQISVWGVYGGTAGKGTQGQGNDGVRPEGYGGRIIEYAGGGGGAGGVGTECSMYKDGNGAEHYVSGDGGAGLPCDITGKEVWYAGGGAGGANAYWGSLTVNGGLGGGGSAWSSSVNPIGSSAENGVDGTGGGGAGGCGGVGSGYTHCAGGRGGNGVVIVRILEVEPLGLSLFFR